MTLVPHVQKFGGEDAAIAAIWQQKIPAQIASQFGQGVLELDNELFGPKRPFGASLTNCVYDADQDGDYYVVTVRINGILESSTLKCVDYGSVDPSEVEVGKTDSDADYVWKGFTFRAVIRTDDVATQLGLTAAAEFYSETELEFSERQKAYRVWLALSPGGSLRFTLDAAARIDAVDMSDLQFFGKGFQGKPLETTALPRPKRTKAFAFAGVEPAALPKAAKAAKIPKRLAAG